MKRFSCGTTLATCGARSARGERGLPERWTGLNGSLEQQRNQGRKRKQNKKLPVFGDGKNVRDWIFAPDNCAGIYTALMKGNLGEVYNIGGGNEKNNLEITRLILEILGKPESLITFVEDRLGHDKRYSLDSSKIMKFGWKPEWKFEDALTETINWYVENPMLFSRV